MGIHFTSSLIRFFPQNENMGIGGGFQAAVTARLLLLLLTGQVSFRCTLQHRKKWFAWQLMGEL
jgi:hypothetical protein